MATVTSEAKRGSEPVGLIDPEEREERARIPFRERLYCSIAEARQVTSLSNTKIYEMMKDGRIAYVQVDGRRLIKIESLLRL
jgi:excisionase family DNA binding protein